MLRSAVTLIRTRLEHRRIERGSRAALEEQQLAKLRRLAVHAARSSPYWAGVVERHRIDPPRCRLQDFPVLTKQEMMDNFDAFVTAPDVRLSEIWDFMYASRDPVTLFRGRYVVLNSSGTSGTPAVYCYDLDSWMRAVARSQRFNPPAFRRKRVAHYGRQGHAAGAKTMHSLRMGPMKLFHRLEAIDSTVAVEEAVARLNRFQPEILGGYPSTIGLLVEQQLAGALRIRPRRVFLSGEPLTAKVAAEVRRAFGVRPRNLYYTSEHLLMAVDLRGAGVDGLALMEDDLIFEFEGERTLVTNLANRTQPLIRYMSDDVLRPMAEPAGPWPFTRISAIEGRVNHNLIFRTDTGRLEAFNFHNITTLMLRYVRKYQIEQFDETRFAFRVVLEAGLSPEERLAAVELTRGELAGRLAENRMTTLDFTVEALDAIPVNPVTDKFELVIPAPKQG